MNAPQTPPHIITVVVYTLAGLGILHTITLCVLVIRGHVVPEALGTQFYSLGGQLIAGLLGLLASTRTIPAPPPETITETTVKEVTKTPPEPEKP